MATSDAPIGSGSTPVRRSYGPERATKAVSGAATGYPHPGATLRGRAALGRLPRPQARAKRKGRQVRPEPHG